MNVQIQRAIEAAITSQVLSRIRFSVRHIEESVGTGGNVREEQEPRSEELQRRERNTPLTFNNGSTCTLNRSKATLQLSWVRNLKTFTFFYGIGKFL